MFDDSMLVQPSALGLDPNQPLYLEIGVPVLVAILEDNIQAIERYLLANPVGGLERQLLLDGLEQRRAVLMRLRAIDPAIQPNIYSGVFWAPEIGVPLQTDDAWLQ